MQHVLLMKPLKNLILLLGRSNQLQFTTLHMRNPRNPSRIQILMILALNVSDVVNPSARSTSKYAKAQNVHCNECGKHGHFQIVCKSLGQFPRRAQRQQNSSSTDRKQTHYVSDAPVQSATGYYNEQGNWVAEPPRPSPVIQTAHLVSVKQKVPVIQDIHPEIDPETSLTQGMTKSQNSFTENSKTFSFSKDPVSPRLGSNLQAFPTEKAAYTAEIDQFLQFFRLTGFPGISKRSGHSEFYRSFCSELP